MMRKGTRLVHIRNGRPGAVLGNALADGQLAAVIGVEVQTGSDIGTIVGGGPRSTTITTAALVLVVVLSIGGGGGGPRLDLFLSTIDGGTAVVVVVCGRPAAETVVQLSHHPTIPLSSKLIDTSDGLCLALKTVAFQLCLWDSAVTLESPDTLLFGTDAKAIVTRLSLLSIGGGWWVEGRHISLVVEVFPPSVVGVKETVH